MQRVRSRDENKRDLARDKYIFIAEGSSPLRGDIYKYLNRKPIPYSYLYG